MSFFEGAVSYHEIKTMPLSELLALEAEAVNISKLRNDEMARARRGK